MLSTLRRAAALAVLALAVLSPAPTARAARFTSHLDFIEAEVTARDGALTGDLTKDQKKEKAAYAKVLKFLAGDTASLLDELKLAGKVAKVLEGALPGDVEMLLLLDEAVDSLASETDVELDGLDLEVDAEPDSKGRERADRALLLAFAYLQDSPLEESFFLRLKLLQKALLKTKPVVKFLAGSGGGGGGGGGGGNCYAGTRALLAGESCTATYGTTTFTAQSVNTQYQTAPFFRAGGAFHRCTPGLHEQFEIVFSSAPTLDTPIPYGALDPTAVYYGSGDPDGLTQIFFGSGTLTFTEIDTNSGTYAGTFTFTSGSAGIDVQNGTFRMVGVK